MKKILIIGATSAIAEAAARIWAGNGEKLFLFARNPEKLEAIAADLRVRGCQKVETYVMDVNDLDAHSPMLDSAERVLHGLDAVLIAHGSLPDQAACQASVELTLSEIGTNALSTIALLTLIANRFEQRRRGMIAVISSVAVDRGRQSNHVYGAAKGGLQRALEGWRHRLFRAGVAVLDIRPGFVATRMTEGLDRKGPLRATADAVAADIVQAVAARQAVLYTPSFWRGIMMVVRTVPRALFHRSSL